MSPVIRRHTKVGVVLFGDASVAGAFIDAFADGMAQELRTIPQQLGVQGSTSCPWLCGLSDALRLVSHDPGLARVFSDTINDLRPSSRDTLGQNPRISLAFEVSAHDRIMSPGRELRCSLRSLA